MRSIRLLARTVATLAVLGAGLAAPTAHAADYRLWFDNADAPIGVVPGDITAGNGKLQPPAWGCGLRVLMPTNFRFQGEFFNDIEAGDLDNDVILWTAACGGTRGMHKVPYGTGLQAVTPPGVHRLEVSGSYGSYWVNKDGARPSCNGCAFPGGFKTLAGHIHWVVASSVLQTARDAIVEGRTRVAQPRLVDALARVVSLHQRTASAVTDRRRTPFADFEPLIRSLEDRAMASLQTAQTLADACQRNWQAGRNADAFAACQRADEAVADAAAALRMAVVQVDGPPSRPLR